MVKKVLYIDDDVWLCDLMLARLKQAGYEAVAASNGVEGMMKIDEGQPDVIVLDLFMPGPNGLVLLHELQSYSDLAQIPVILCTNSVSDIPHVSKLEPYGVRAVLDKTTMEPGDVVSAVRRLTWA